MRFIALVLAMCGSTIAIVLKRAADILASIHADAGGPRPALVMECEGVAQVDFVPSIYPKRPCSATHGFA
jgi:hypothetical protein